MKATINGIEFEKIIRPDAGNIIVQVGQPGIVWARKDGNVYRAVYNKKTASFDETLINGVPKAEFDAAFGLR